MEARYHRRSLWCVTGLTLLATRQASAGPYPLDDLLVWLKDENTKLAAVQAEITKLESQIPRVEAVVAKATAAARSAGTTRVADVDREAELMNARRMLLELRHDLTELYARRQEILNEILLIRVQISAWAEIERERP